MLSVAPGCAHRKRTGLAEPELAILPLAGSGCAQLRRDASTCHVMMAGHGTDHRARGSLQSDCRDDGAAGQPLSCARHGRQASLHQGCSPPSVTPRRDAILRALCSTNRCESMKSKVTYPTKVHEKLSIGLFGESGERRPAPRPTKSGVWADPKDAGDAALGRRPRPEHLVQHKVVRFFWRKAVDLLLPNGG